MKTLFVAYRVTDLDHSLDFYSTLGYVELGSVAGEGGRLVVLGFPDEPVATLELVHHPGGRVEVGGFDHLAIQVDALAPTARRRRGSPTLTVTGSSWWSGRPDILALGATGIRHHRPDQHRHRQPASRRSPAIPTRGLG